MTAISSRFDTFCALLHSATPQALDMVEEKLKAKKLTHEEFVECLAMLDEAIGDGVLVYGDRYKLHALLLKVLEHKPESPFALSRLGVLLQHSDSMQGEIYLNDALIINPSDSYALAHLGEYYITNKPTKAKELLEQAVQLNPEYLFAQELLGVVYGILSKQCLAKALELSTCGQQKAE